ncbi:MAG: bifunctional tryptophan synthase trp1 [Phylliscum demangeonii]|nr:MAG: bifunctional tryptophan synthase trp1 [Phylliscum demangeonii]
MLDLIDYSSGQAAPGPLVPEACRLILIDNYDSFTWNIYQYLVLEGATVSVFRNDELSVGQLIEKNPTQLVISPGPGHPDRDSGISRDAIKYFAGKIPVMGVCMGLQCIISVFGGQVEYAGEILHGKTSGLSHDSQGLYKDVPQGIPVTRYHSLAGTHVTLPECLAISSWSTRDADDGNATVIMGVRHTDFTVEGVQFHPESILTAEGRHMLKNFLQMRGGTWEEMEDVRASGSTGASNINGQLGAAIASTNGAASDRGASMLGAIYDHRQATMEAKMQVPSQSLGDLESLYKMNLSPPQISFAARLQQSPYALSLMAEIKRASPSKGDISLTTCAPAQARIYAEAGASAISVLTEPKWFKGSMNDLRAVRQALEGYVERPAILQKDFIFSEYQILEARVAGADSVLLIVKMLDERRLATLYRYALSLSMEPLVEVNNAQEMRMAIELGAKVVGVNNRNLTSFDVDLETTSRLVNMAPKDVTICALSGISSSQDVQRYQTQGVQAILVGEALMRAARPAVFIKDLLGPPVEPVMEGRNECRPLLVKICGNRTAEAARVAIEAGADFIGIILVPGRSRSVTIANARQISEVVHSRRGSRPDASRSNHPKGALSWFEHQTRLLRSRQGPQLVGVFRDQPLADIFRMQEELQLDIVQLHGSEPVEWARLIPVPVLRRFRPDDGDIGRTGYHALPLLDSAEGGSGHRLDTTAIGRTLEKDDGLRVILAGGLDAHNLAAAVGEIGKAGQRVVGVDVSSGVEENGVQSLEKIRAFVRAAKEIV